jgi:hypothetical protein
MLCNRVDLLARSRRHRFLHAVAFGFLPYAALTACAVLRVKAPGVKTRQSGLVINNAKGSHPMRLSRPFILLAASLVLFSVTPSRRRWPALQAGFVAAGRSHLGAARDAKDVDRRPGGGRIAVFDKVWAIRHAIHSPQGGRARFAVHGTIHLGFRAIRAVAGRLVG